MPSTFAVPSTLLPDPVVAHSHADSVVAHDHVPTQFDEESAVDTQSDDPFQFDDPPVPAPVILSQSKPVYDHHRDDLPHHIRAQLQQSRIRKPAQNLEPDAKRVRLTAGKRAVLLLSHDVSSVPECCKPVTIFKSCGNSGECVDVLLTRQTANKEVQYDALMKLQQERVDVAMTREWDKWNEFGVTKFLSKKQLNDIMKRNPDQKIVGTRWVFTEKVIQGKPDYKARLVVQGCKEDKGYIRTDAPTGSRDAFFMTLSAAAQSGWDYSVFDAQSAYQQSDGTKRLLLLRMPHKNQPPGDEAGASVCCYWFESTGREMLDVRGTSTARKCLRLLGSWSQGWSKAFTTCMDLLDLRLSCTRMSTTSVCVQENLQEIHGCFATSCARASFETTVRLGCVLRKDHLQRWQSHQSDTNQVNDESRIHEH